jgi:flagellar biosynthesis protein FlhF
MQIKRFEAATMTAALKMVKDEFGPEAVILSARTLHRNRGFWGGVRAAGVELTAAIDCEWPGNRADRRWVPPRVAPPAASPAETPTVRRGILNSLNASLRSIAGRRSRPAAPDGPAARSTDLAELHRHWTSQEIAPDIAMEFSEHLQCLPGYDPLAGLDRLRPLAETALHDMGLRPFCEPSEPGSRKMMALVRPSGVGKTVLAVKLAAVEALQHRRRVGLLSLDDRRIGSVEQIRIYAEILGVPCAVAGTPAEAQQRVEEWASLEQIIIDTSGVSPGEDEHRTEVQEILHAVKCREVHLVLNAVWRECDLMPIIAAWKKTPLSSLAFTRLDETRLYGGLLNSALRSRLPLSWLSTGPRIPEDLTERSLDHLLDRLWPYRRTPELQVKAVVHTHGPSTAAPEPAGWTAPLVANRNSELYHRIDCKWARKIKDDHLLRFASAAEAEAKNFHACRSCCPAEHASAVGGGFSLETARLSGCR